MPTSRVVTLDELRKKFWWLGPSVRDSYIVALDGDTVTIKVIQCSWNRRTQKYEEAVARDFEALGLRVEWRPFFSEKLMAEIEKAREKLGANLTRGGSWTNSARRSCDGWRTSDDRREGVTSVDCCLPAARLP